MTTIGKRSYPFVTRKQIQARLAAEPAFVTECAVILEARTRDRAAGAASAGGWMSSQRVVAGRLVEAVRAGTISDPDRVRLQAMVARYTKQIADHFRALHLLDHPELIETAKLFSVTVPGGPGAPAASVATVLAPHDEGAAEPSPTDEPAGIMDDGPEDETVARVIEALHATPGLRSEELSVHLGIATAFLSPALRKLIEDGQIRRTGAGRGTRYFVR